MSGWTGSGRFKGRVQQLVGYQNLAGTEVQLGALTWGGQRFACLVVSFSSSHHGTPWRNTHEVLPCVKSILHVWGFSCMSGERGQDSFTSVFVRLCWVATCDVFVHS